MTAKTKSITLHSGIEANFWLKCLKTLDLWLQKRHQRKQLAQIGIDQLVDMGIDPADAQREAAKPFWK